MQLLRELTQIGTAGAVAAALIVLMGAFFALGVRLAGGLCG
jgi:hypothetical protein